MRIGIGYDIHRLVKDRKLILGGIEIFCESGLAGHSDADALIHAILDALLGAAALGDIGLHFPDDDPRWKDVSSTELLGNIANLLKDNNIDIINIDSIIIAQYPKMASYIESMRKKIAETLGIEIDKISVKAKTNEGMDSIGRGEAIACHAIALIDSH